ncbi:MAG: DUF4199 domain-containing protein [Bacteroidota bacterium]
MDEMSSEEKEEQQIEIKKQKARFILNQGAYMGLALAVAYYITHVTGLMETFFHNLLSWGVYIGFIHISMVRYRDRLQDGLLSYGQGVWLGTRMGFLAGIVLGAYLFLYMKVINPGYVEEMIVQMQETYLQMGVPENEVANMEEMFKLTANPAMMVISGVLGAGFTSLIFSLVIAIFQKRKGDPFSDAMKNVE